MIFEFIDKIFIMDILINVFLGDLIEDDVYVIIYGLFVNLDVDFI